MDYLSVSLISSLQFCNDSVWTNTQCAVDDVPEYYTISRDFLLLADLSMELCGDSFRMIRIQKCRVSQMGLDVHHTKDDKLYGMNT